MTRTADRVERELRAWGGENALLLAGHLSALVSNSSYARERAQELEEIARDKGVGWPIRRLAMLMFETALARIDAKSETERRYWLRRLGATDSAELRREGFSDSVTFDVQMWRRLTRFHRIHRLLIAARKSDVALRDFLHASNRECRLTFARYLFSVHEVIARIEANVRRSEGIANTHQYGEYNAEARRSLESLPAMERAIARHLMKDAVIRWTAVPMTSEINSLVAQPIGTVVLVIRPPGSDREIQIKRAGRARHLPLDVLWRRNGKELPSAHYLDGGSEQGPTLYEAESAGFFSRVFREVHGFDAAMSRSLSIARIDTIPTTNGEVDLMDYFTKPQVYGDRYFEMRWNLYHVVRLAAENGRAPFTPGNDASLTRDFIRNVKPAQAVQLGTTALRLDRIHRYLSPIGANAYFQDGLGIAHDADDDRRFADELLDEILGVYEPPGGPWHSYERHVDDAFRVPKNRARADNVYLSLFEQIGRFWGTLMAIRGFTRGESFVERNVGLRSVWLDGQWQVQIVFMDHDSMTFGTLRTTTFRPRVSQRAAILDTDHVFGGVLADIQCERGEVGCLREIYRVTETLHQRAMTMLRATAKSAYDSTHDAIEKKPALTALFPQAIVPRLKDWDELVRMYLFAKTRKELEEWPKNARALLRSRGYDYGAIEEHLELIPSDAWYLRFISFLY